MFPTANLETLASVVFSSERGLLQDETLLDLLHVDARLIAERKRGVIGGEILTKQRKTKTALPLKGTVTCPAVTAEPAQQRHHMSLEIRRLFGLLGKPIARREKEFLRTNRWRSEK